MTSTVRVDFELGRLVDEEAAREDVSASSIVRRALRHYLPAVPRRL
ncbi:MAG: ribbon-helix-helix protein, CopG family [Candidatus Dormibacteraceae bacterium]